MKKILLLLITATLLITASAQELEITLLKEFPRASIVQDVRFSPLRNFFALTRSNNVVEIYNRDWKLVHKYQGQGLQRSGPSKIAFSPDERVIAISKYMSNSDIIIIRLSDLKILQTIRSSSFAINDLQFSNDGNLLVAAYDKSIVIRKQMGDEFIVHQETMISDEGVNNVDFSFDDRYLLTLDEDGFISILERKKDQFILKQQIKDRRYFGDRSGFDYHPWKHRFITSGTSGIRRYELDKSNFILKDSITEGLDVRYDFEYSSDGAYVSFTNFTRIKIFSTDEKMKEVDNIIRNNFWTIGSRFSGDGRQFATFSTDSSLTIWDISPLDPSRQYSIYSWMNKKLSPAQLKILNYNVSNDIFNRVARSMTDPRDEFETTKIYNERRSSLEDWTLSIIQKKVEEIYSIKPEKDNHISIPLQNLIGYNADKQIYKVRFLEVEAGVEIPIKEAKKLKTSWEKARIFANKTKRDNGVSFNYTNYQMEIPGITGTFKVTPLENPLVFEDIRSVSIPTTKQKELPAEEAIQQNDNSDIITHALLFGTNVYDSFSELVNPVLDANTIAAELSESYGVNTEVVLNSTLMQTADKLREYASKSYSENENLLIFFAGHGVYDEVFKEGYVISSNSRADDISKTSYLSHSNLRTMVNNIGCKRIFLVMDVCFGGTFDPHMATAGHRGSMEMYADISKDEFIKRKSKYKTRLYLTSGGKEYVPDGRSGFHSPFARKFIEALRKYGGDDGVLTTSEIMLYVEKVDPQPRFGEFGDNEPGSDFILISK